MIIKSLLDTDYYKFSMGQYAWKYFPKVKVKYAFKNRTKDIQLGNMINTIELLSELDWVRSLRFTMEELNYLKSLKIFSNEYLSYLSKLALPPVFVEKKDGELIIETEGYWPEAIFWETYILSIVNELYCREAKQGIPLSGDIQLDVKLELANLQNIKFVDFGTRRRFSAYWHKHVIQKILEYDCSGFLGTSNVHLAHLYNLKPIGTLAHELPMVLAGINDYSGITLKNSHDKMLTLWEYMYGKDLSIALTDTFGTDFFFRDFTTEKAKFWKGLRQDSGDPFKFGEKAIEFYKSKGINPKEKLVVFSDGLDIKKIMALETQFKDKFITAYGWGTNLTNDRGIKPLSIVVKAVEANGRPLIKLSDNLAKAIGSKGMMKKYKEVFIYNNTYTEQPLY